MADPFSRTLGTGSLFGGDPGRFQERSRKVKKEKERKPKKSLLPSKLPPR